MSECEIKWMVNAGWSLASSPWPATIPRFSVRGPLPRYVLRLSQFDMASMPRSLAEFGCPPEDCAGRKCSSLTLRQATEATAFGVALSMARDPADREVRRRIGDDVVTSLGSARVSMVVVVDPSLVKHEVKKPMKKGGPPGRLECLTRTLAGETRTPRRWSVPEQRKYRLDRPFVDEDTYVFGVLPQNRCVVIASAVDAQHGRRESGLMQATSAAYMTIGAATAIGTLRAIDHDLERVGDSEPEKIAGIEREIAANLHEIYDLDITREVYRHLYRRLRDRLGITRDYKTLQDKMQALYRATATRYEGKAQVRLTRLTAAIVVLSVLILIGTIVVAAKP